ncbi:MAG: hypothetical protein K0S56_1617, partial [Microvirga sp.]|nr:hypothetical protein [Microvirga sp.]
MDQAIATVLSDTNALRTLGFSSRRPHQPCSTRRPTRPASDTGTDGGRFVDLAASASMPQGGNDGGGLAVQFGLSDGFAQDDQAPIEGGRDQIERELA